MYVTLPLLFPFNLDTPKHPSSPNTTVCPTCSNMLRVSKVPAGDPATEQYADQNRFECLTCPYQYIIKKRFYERKVLPLRNVDDVIGGEGAWDGVEKARSMLILLCCVEEIWKWRRWRSVKWMGMGTGPVECEMEEWMDANECHSAMSRREMPKRRGVLVCAADSQCR